MPPLETTTDSPGETPKVPQDPCEHWRGILRFRHQLHTRFEAPASTGEESRGFLSSADMDLGVLLVSPQRSQSSSPVGEITCAFLSSCSSRGTLTFAWIKGSVAFPRGFPTSLSHRAGPGATVVCMDPRLESRGSAGKTGIPGMD